MTGIITYAMASCFLCIIIIITMGKRLYNALYIALLLMAGAITIQSCTPGIQLTASWHDKKVIPQKFSKILVLSIGKSLDKRKLGEDKLKAQLQEQGFSAESGLDVFTPDFAKGFDSLKMQQALIDKGFDAVLTIRVLSIEENNRWVPALGTYSSPAYIYNGFYRYYNVYGLYPGSAYMTTDVKVLLESNLYNVKSGSLLWSGQSLAFSRDPTPQMAERYAKNVVASLLKTQVIVP